MINSMTLASQIVQMNTEAKASPIITALTTMSAAMNMPQGDRSRGSLNTTSGLGTSDGRPSWAARAGTDESPDAGATLGAACCGWVMAAPLASGVCANAESGTMRLSAKTTTGPSNAFRPRMLRLVCTCNP
jgi:hypothetical protein